MFCQNEEKLTPFFTTIFFFFFGWVVGAKFQLNFISHGKILWNNEQVMLVKASYFHCILFFSQVKLCQK